MYNNNVDNENDCVSNSKTSAIFSFFLIDNLHQKQVKIVFLHALEPKKLAYRSISFRWAGPYVQIFMGIDFCLYEVFDLSLLFLSPAQKMY